MRMNTNNGFWSYFWTTLTGFFTMLTLQDVLFAGGAVITALFTWLTYRSNNRRNQVAIEEERKRTKIVAEAYAIPRHGVTQPAIDAGGLNGDESSVPQ